MFVYYVFIVCGSFSLPAPLGFQCLMVLGFRDGSGVQDLGINDGHGVWGLGLNQGWYWGVASPKEEERMVQVFYMNYCLNS